MAETTNTTKGTQPIEVKSEPRFLPWSDWTWAALLMRFCAAALLLLSGLDKFKSATNPATYSLDNYYGSAAEVADPNYKPKFVKIVNVVFSNSGFDNSVNFGGNVKLANAAAWSFYRFGQVLPWMMIVSGIMILFGILNRLGHFIGGFVWISLIIGQLLLPDIETVVRLLVVFLVGVGALGLLKHNRLTLTRF